MSPLNAPLIGTCFGHPSSPTSWGCCRTPPCHSRVKPALGSDIHFTSRHLQIDLGRRRRRSNLSEGLGGSEDGTCGPQIQTLADTGLNLCKDSPLP